MDYLCVVLELEAEADVLFQELNELDRPAWLV